MRLQKQILFFLHFSISERQSFSMGPRTRSEKVADERVGHELRHMFRDVASVLDCGDAGPEGALACHVQYPGVLKC
jgi:hypothetical protein